MNLIFIVFIFFILLISFILVYLKIENNKLIKSVTSLSRGNKSERKMILKLLKSGVKSTAIFHDIYINNGNGKYSQIDLVVATNIGIIVFEIKKYNGWIFGTQNQVNWTQLLAYGKQKYKFYNPILQNKKHVEDLKKNYLFENIPVYSMIVFFGDCEFKNNIELPNQTFFTKSNNAIEKFNEILQYHQFVEYKDKWEIVSFFKETVKNGENSIIRQMHLDSIKRLKNRNIIN